MRDPKSKVLIGIAVTAILLSATALAAPALAQSEWALSDFDGEGLKGDAPGSTLDRQALVAFYRETRTPNNIWGYDFAQLPSSQVPETRKEAEQAALVALYNATGGSNWANNANWVSGQTSSQTTTDPALQRYADDNAGGPGAIYVGDISQLAGPAPDNDTLLGDRNGMVPLADLRDHRWLYESGYYRSLLDRANLINPTRLTSSRANIQLKYVCISRALLSCSLLEKYWAPNLEARTNGQLTLEVVSFLELGVAGPDTLELVSNGTLDMAEIYGGYVSHQLPLLELQFLTSLYPDQETMFNSVAEMLPTLEEAVQGATGGGLTINHNWQSGNDNYIFADKPLQTVDDFDGLSTRSFSATMSDWLGGMGAEAQFVGFADVYTALKQGIIDAAVTRPDAAFGQRWYEVVDYMNGPLTSFLATHNVVNADVWEAIPADLQQILVEEGAKAELEAMRLASVQNLEPVRKNIEAGLEVVEFPPEVKERSFDVALIQHVIPGWLHRLDYPNEGDQAVEVFNEHVGPFVGLRIQSGGSVEKTEITKGPHSAMADRAALVALYNATGGPNWNSNNNWLSDVPISEWSGVTTDDNGRVTELELGQNQLTGPIPAELGNLSNLRGLFLSGNQLTGPIPAELARLTNLTALHLSGNRLTGCVPASLRDVADNDFAELELPFCASEDPLIARYDTNRNGAIDISELFSAIDDYFADRIDISQLFGVIELYFSGPTPTPTGPQAVDDYIVWKVGDDVSPTAEAETRETVHEVHDYAVGIGMPRIDRPIFIFLYHNLDSLAAEFEATTGRVFEDWVGPDFAAGRRTILASRDFIAVNTSAEDYQEYSSGQHKEDFVRRLFDVYRRALTGIWQGTPRDAVDPEGPQWLRAGSREYLTWQALRAAGPESCDPTRGRYARFRETADTPLSDAETQSGYESMRSARQHSFLAVELLAEQAGPESMMGYFASLRTGVTWQEAFESAFGMAVEEFYQLFDERSAAGFTRPRCPLLPPLVTLPGAPDYVKWEIGSGVRPEYIEDSVEGVRLMHEYAESLGMPEIEVKFTAHLYYNQDELKIAYLLATGSEAEWVDRGSNAVAYGPGFFTDTLRWEERNTSSDDRKKISAHELFHVFQEEWSSGYSEPRWLTEGTAEYFAFRALDAGGVWSYAEQRRERLVAAGKGAVEPLRELEEALDRVSYDFLLLAVELLASRAGERAVLDYYMLRQPGTTWQETFQGAFGMSVEEFYELFEAHRAAGFLQPTALAHPSDILDWFDDPPDEAHSYAAKSIARIYDLYPDIGSGVARLPWVADGITWNEEFVLEELSYVVSEDPELVRAVVNQEHRSYLLGLGSDSARRAADYPWLADGLDARELYAIIEIARIAKRNPGFAELVLGYTWLADGITEYESRGLGALSRWALLDPELVDRLLKYRWLDDGITDTEVAALSILHAFAERAGVEATKQVMDYQWLTDGVTWEEHELIAELAILVEDDPDAARQISRGTLGPYLLGLLVSDSARRAADYPWLADGLDVREMQAIIGMAVIAKQAPELAERLLGYTWLADGVSERESNGISTLADIAHINLELARQVVGMGILDDPLRDRDLHAITSLRRLVETDDLALLTSQPWFTDGLSDEETAFLVVTNRDQHSDSQYRDFLRTHFTRSATISLPLAGDVDLWVFWHLPFPDSDDSIELIEDAVRASEALMGVPFPTTDIILLLGDPDSISLSGYHAGSHMAMDRIVEEGNHRGIVYHETAHYYYMGIHSWFNEGFADLVVTYTMTRVGLRSFADREDYLEQYDLPECIELGFRNIQELLDKGGHACLGEFILVSLFNLLGEEATSAALRELYLMSETEGREQGEEDFYRIFLKHTPPGLEDEFRDLYRRLHGGPYADAEK